MDWINRLLDFVFSFFLFIEEKRVDDAKAEAEVAKLGQQLAENKNEIYEKYDGVSDADVVNEVIRSGGGSTTDTVSVVEDSSKGTGRRPQS